jgi:hypothetical protein
MGSRADIVKELYAPLRRNFPRRKYILKGANDLLSTDLADMQKLSKSNDGVKYLLVVVNAFTKKLYVEPLKNKTSDETARKMEKILDEIKLKMKNLVCDLGKEFEGKFKALMSKRSINMYHTYSEVKASHAERAILTLKQRIYKDLAMRGSNRYIDHLKGIVENYNNTKHSTTKMKPNDVKKQHEKLLLETVFKDRRVRVNVPLKVGDVVRIARSRFTFEKSYFPNWSIELFKIKAINEKNPPTVTLTNYDGTEDIRGSFYLKEIKKVKYPDLFLVEKVLKYNKSKTQALVKWQDYEKPTWVNAKTLTDAEK